MLEQQESSVRLLIAFATVSDCALRRSTRQRVNSRRVVLVFFALGRQAWPVPAASAH
jgi:hypothetical protein